MLLFFLLKLTVITARLPCPPLLHSPPVLPLSAPPTTIIGRIVVVAVSCELSPQSPVFTGQAGTNRLTTKLDVESNENEKK